MDYRKEHKRLEELLDWQSNGFALGSAALVLMSLIEVGSLLCFTVCTLMLGRYTLGAALSSCRTSRAMKENERLYEESRPAVIAHNGFFNVKMIIERKPK